MEAIQILTATFRFGSSADAGRMIPTIPHVIRNQIITLGQSPFLFLPPPWERLLLRDSDRVRTCGQRTTSARPRFTPGRSASRMLSIRVSGASADPSAKKPRKQRLGAAAQRKRDRSVAEAISRGSTHGGASTTWPAASESRPKVRRRVVGRGSPLSCIYGPTFLPVGVTSMTTVVEPAVFAFSKRTCECSRHHPTASAAAPTNHHQLLDSGGGIARKPLSSSSALARSAAASARERLNSPDSRSFSRSRF